MKFKPQFIREYTVQLIRDYFITRQYHEVDTPTLMPQIPIEPNLYPLKTTWAERNVDFYLATSPESSLKKLIAQGIGNCFAISKVFRDLENIGPTHNLEFSMLEWYEMNKNYKDIANTTIKLVNNIFLGINKILNNKATNILNYQGSQIDLSSPWNECILNDLFKSYADMDLSQNLTTKNIKQTAQKKGYNIDSVNTWEPLYTQIFINEIEPKLPTDKPTIIYDYPTRQSPLCAPCPESPGFSQRFEFYIGGMEIGNAYTELTDPQIVENNFQKETILRQKYKLPIHPYDRDFIKAIGKLPPCAGIGLGVDRLSMLFADTPNIEDVLYFSTSKLLSS
jgi:elongation factor P--beta-lysine ligase